MLGAVRKLFSRLNDSGIRYCHWKSNYNLERALAGEGDIDILVSTGDIHRVLGILSSLGFKRARHELAVRHPSMAHFHGLDDGTGQLVHVHLYSEVVTGDSLVKNYVFPVAEMLLTQCDQIRDINVPARPKELLLFVLRVVLKQASLAEQIMLWRDRKNVREEAKWLMADGADSKVLPFLREWFPSVRGGLFREALRVAESGNLVAGVFCAWRLQGRLRRFRRYQGWVRGLRTYLCVIKWGLAKINLGFQGMTFAGRGAVIALVGPKASGKSTLAQAICDWLGEHFAVLQVHSGKPPSTLLTCFPNLFVPLLRILLPEHRSIAYDKSPERKAEGYSLLSMVRKVLLAYDRQRLLAKCRRRRNQGAIVVSDRYPSPVVGSTDGPALEGVEIKGVGSKVRSCLVKLERRLYERIPLPDVVIYLSVPLDVAICRDQHRDKKHAVRDPDYVRATHELVIDPAFPDTPCLRVSTDVPLDKTLRAVKKFVWGHL